MKERNITLDNAKGIGIILVIAGHLFPKGSIPFMYIFAFHMPLFFIISGYVLNPDKYAKFTDCARTSFKRYIKPYFVFCIIGFIVSLPINFYGVICGKSTVYQLVVKVLYEVFWKTNPFSLLMGSLWFLVVLFLSIVMGWFIIKRYKDSVYRYIVFLLLPTLSYLLFLFQHASLMPEFVKDSLPLKMASVPICTFFIILGFELKDRNFVFKLSFYTFMIFIIAAVLIPFNGTVNISTPIFGNMVLFVLNALLGCYAVLTLSSIKWPKFISWIGQNSLIIFAMHGVWIFVYSHVLKLLFGYSEIPPLLSIIGLIMIVGLSLPTVIVVKPVYNYIIQKI